MGDFVKENLLQHAEDLDYIQDVLNVVGSFSELNPTLHAVLAGFNRRRISGSFKDGHQSVIMDRLRFSHLASANENNRGNRYRKKQGKRSFVSRECHFYQLSSGCFNSDRCKYEHKCIICGAHSHGAFSCREVGQKNISSNRSKTSYSRKGSYKRRKYSSCG